MRLRTSRSMLITALTAIAALLVAMTCTGVTASAASAASSEWFSSGPINKPYTTHGPIHQCGNKRWASGDSPLVCSVSKSHSITSSISFQAGVGINLGDIGVAQLNSTLGFSVTSTVQVTGSDTGPKTQPSSNDGKYVYINWAAAEQAEQVLLVKYVCTAVFGNCTGDPSTNAWWQPSGTSTVATVRHGTGGVQFFEGVKDKLSEVPDMVSLSTADSAGFQNAFDAAGTADLWTTGSNLDDADSTLGMEAGTSPAIAALIEGGYEVAFQANDNDLWVSGPNGDYDTGQGMMPGTSPAITPLYLGGYEVAFQANTGVLWTYDDVNGPADLGLGMAGGTSPAITWQGGSGYEIAFQANTGIEWTTGASGTVNFGAAGVMMPGTSPSITVLAAGGYETAFQNNQGVLTTLGNADWKNWGAGMDPGSSPSITIASGGYEVAFQTNTHDLWTLGTDGYKDWELGMAPGTSPAIGSVSSGGAGFETAFQANTGDLWNAGALGTGGSSYGLWPGTSPSITAV